MELFNFVALTIAAACFSPSEAIGGPRASIIMSENVVKWELLHHDRKSLPENTIVGGYQLLEGGKECAQYVARAPLREAIVPGRLTKYPEREEYNFYISWGKEKETAGFEVAVARPGTVQWVPARNGDVPADAVPAGIAPSGETLYACRAFNASVYKGRAMMYSNGYLQPSRGVCNVEWQGSNDFTTYQVLTAIKGIDIALLDEGIPE